VRYFTLLLLAGLASCAVLKKTRETGSVPAEQNLSPLYIYKTRADYHRFVPIGLSDDRKSVVSYPDPSDLRYGIPPEKLAHGYWLDTRGIGLQVAYTNYTYKEYAALSAPPSLDSLMMRLVDTDPISRFCQCGTWNDYGNSKKELNKLIRSGKLETRCKVLK
jgi:hypothetical protein